MCVTVGGGYYGFGRAEFGSVLRGMDDLYVGGGAGYGFFGVDIYLTLRYFVLETYPQGSSLFVNVEGHGLPGVAPIAVDAGAGGGGVLGIGWEYRNRDGLLFRAHGGLGFFGFQDGGFGAVPALGVDVGYSF